MSPARSHRNVRLGALVRRAREAKGLSLRQLERVSGVPYDYIAYLEMGRYTDPSPDRLHRLAQALDQNIEDYYAVMWRPPQYELPALKPYLRARYDLPDEAIDELNTYFDELSRRYRHGDEGRDGTDEHQHEHHPPAQRPRPGP